MKQLAALAWKEWHEVRIYLWIALGVFVGLPVIGMLEAKYQHVGGRYEISASPWVLIFGGVLAVFVAVGATCRDFSGRLEDFWRSRPLNVGRWLLVKYFVGLAVVLASCVLPLVVELCIDKQKQALLFAVWFPFMWAAAYSLGFLSGCLLRRTAHAAMLALAGMLLVWFLPLVLPPLQWMSLTVITSYYLPALQWPDVFDARFVQFAAGMAAVAVLMAIVSIQIARRGWRIEAGPKMMYGSVSAALLILFASAAFQLGTNLPVLQQVDLPQMDSPSRIASSRLRCVGQRGFIMAEYFPDTPQLQIGQVKFKLRTFDLTPSGIKLESTIREVTDSLFWGYQGAVWAPNDLGIGYVVDNMGGDGRDEYMLRAVSLETEAKGEPQFLWEQSDTHSKPIPYGFAVYVRRNRLYVISSHLVVLDISQPLKPRIISNTPFSWPDVPGSPEYQDMDRLVFTLPQVADLSPAERLEATMGSASYINLHSFDGEYLCIADGDVLVAYRLTDLNGITATFKKIGQYEPTILEDVFGLNPYGQMTVQNGLVYAQFYGRSAGVNSSISVFDLRSNPTLRLVGHFSAPGAEVVQPLPDGRAIVGGSKLWLIGPPPKRNPD